MTPQEILEQTRRLVSEHAAGDPDRWWYANRFVFARLILDERRTKIGIKKGLLGAGGPCHACGQRFESKRNIHLHRLDDARGYSATNCVLMHGECHQRHHAKHEERGSAGESTLAAVQPVICKWSKCYEGKPFTYWWDIAPRLAEALCNLEAFEFGKKDSLERCTVPVDTLRKFLTSARQTSRGAGNWGIKVLKDRPDELAFEPPSHADQWLFLPVTWADDSAED